MLGTDEIVQVLDGVARWRTNFPNHERITPESNFSSRVGISETIAIAEAAGLVPVVTHVKAQGPERGTAAALVGLMQNATARGHYTAADLYPYLAGQTGLGALILPGWAQEGGREQLLERFRDPEVRRRIVGEAELAIKARFGGPQSVSLPATQRQLVEVMEELEVSAGEAVVRLLEEENRGAIIRFGRESDLVEFLEFADTVVACDCGASTATRTHPRYYGAFPRVLGRYVREEGRLTWEDAVRKMTGLPAALIGFVDRGFLVAGMVADVTVFDPATVRDRATYEQPAQLSEGIRHVFVNGQLVLTDGRTTGGQAGRILKRITHMPSRPMNLHTSRRVSANGVTGKLRSGVRGRTAGHPPTVGDGKRSKSVAARKIRVVHSTDSLSEQVTSIAILLPAMTRTGVTTLSKPSCRQSVERALAVIAHKEEFLVEWGVAHTGDVTHQLPRRNGPLLFGEAGHVVAHWRVEIEEQAYRCGGHGLCHAPDAEQGLRCHRATLVDIGPAEALGPDDLTGDAHRERQTGEVLLDNQSADERAGPLDGVDVLVCRGHVDLGVDRRGVVAMYVGVAGTPRVDYLAYRSAAGEQRRGQHEERGRRELKEAAESTRCSIHVANSFHRASLPVRRPNRCVRGRGAPRRSFRLASTCPL